MNPPPFDCPTRRQAERMLGASSNESNLGRLHAVMADTPFAAVGIAEQARRRQEEPAPAPHPQRGVVAIDIAQVSFDLLAMRVEIGKPVERGALVMHPAPAPFLFPLEDFSEWPDRMMARHRPAGEEMLRDPVFAV